VHARWERRSLKSRQSVDLWIDGIHFGVRLEEANQCLLVVIGATRGREEGTRGARRRIPGI
jgi:hypothetical protein